MLVDIFMEFIFVNSNVFCLLLCEYIGMLVVYCLVVFCEIQYFIDELSDYIIEQLCIFYDIVVLQVESMVWLVFSVGVDVLEVDIILKNDISD